MKSIAFASLAFAAALYTAQVSAHDDRYDRDRDCYEYRHDSRYDDRYDDRYENRGRFVNARVVRVERLRGYDRDYGRQCYRRGHDSGINNGAVIGAIAGGALGNAAGKGDGRVATTVAGAVIGGLIGQSIDRDNRGGYDRHYIECNNYSGYDRGRGDYYRVTYRYRNRLYTTVMPYHPGRNVRVRMDMTPRYDRQYGYRY